VRTLSKLVGAPGLYTVRPSSVLVVEDDDDVRDALAETVSRAGYRVTTARHGGEALAALDGAGSSPPDVVLLDLMMPVVDGWSVLRHVEASEREVSVLVVTAVREPRLPEHIGVLTKPTSRDTLLAAIEARCPPTIIESPPKVDATLYVRAGCDRSAHARSVLEAILARYECADVSCRVIDVSNAPKEIATAPTLVIRRPLPLTLLDGPVDTQLVTGLFDMAEIPRRRW
jgi:CheY-like chemotaxis protein